MAHCKCCGLPEEQFKDEKLDEEMDGESVRSINRWRRKFNKSPFCSIPCMREKLGI